MKNIFRRIRVNAKLAFRNIKRFIKKMLSTFKSMVTKAVVLLKKAARKVYEAVKVAALFIGTVLVTIVAALGVVLAGIGAGIVILFGFLFRILAVAACIVAAFSAVYGVGVISLAIAPSVLFMLITGLIGMGLIALSGRIKGENLVSNSAKVVVDSVIGITSIYSMLFSVSFMGFLVILRGMQDVVISSFRIIKRNLTLKDNSVSGKLDMVHIDRIMVAI